MTKLRKRRPQGEEIVRTIINKMFEIAGHNVTYDDVVGRKDAWYQEWTMTVAQNDEWKEWMKDYFKNVYLLRIYKFSLLYASYFIY